MGTLVGNVGLSDFVFLMALTKGMLPSIGPLKIEKKRNVSTHSVESLKASIEGLQVTLECPQSSTDFMRLISDFLENKVIDQVFEELSHSLSCSPSQARPIEVLPPSQLCLNLSSGL
jgi:hypothetical protein